MTHPRPRSTASALVGRSLALLLAVCALVAPFAAAAACPNADHLVVVELPPVSVGAVHDHAAAVLGSVLSGLAVEASSPRVAVLLARCMNQGSGKSGCPGRRYQGVLWTPQPLQDSGSLAQCAQNAGAVLGLAVASGGPLTPQRPCSTESVRWERWDVALAAAMSLFEPSASRTVAVVVRSGLRVPLAGLQTSTRQRLVLSLPNGPDKRYGGKSDFLGAYLDAVLPNALADSPSSEALLFAGVESDQMGDDRVPSLTAPSAVWAALPPATERCPPTEPFDMRITVVGNDCRRVPGTERVLVPFRIDSNDAPLFLPLVACASFREGPTIPALSPYQACVDGGRLVASDAFELPVGRTSRLEVLADGFVLPTSAGFGVFETDPGVDVAFVAVHDGRSVKLLRIGKPLVCRGSSA